MQEVPQATMKCVTVIKVFSFRYFCKIITVPYCSYHHFNNRMYLISRLQEIQSSKEATEADESTSEVVNQSISSMLLFEKIVDESESKILCLRMESKIEESVEAPTVLVIPGLEGFGKVLDPLCRNLDAKIYALQLNYQDTPETIFDMAQEKLPVSSYFWLMFDEIFNKIISNNLLTNMSVSVS